MAFNFRNKAKILENRDIPIILKIGNITVEIKTNEY